MSRDQKQFFMISGNQDIKKSKFCIIIRHFRYWFIFCLEILYLILFCLYFGFLLLYRKWFELETNQKKFFTRIKPDSIRFQHIRLFITSNSWTLIPAIVLLISLLWWDLKIAYPTNFYYGGRGAGASKFCWTQNFSYSQFSSKHFFCICDFWIEILLNLFYP